MHCNEMSLRRHARVEHGKAYKVTLNVKKKKGNKKEEEESDEEDFDMLEEEEEMLGDDEDAIDIVKEEFI